MIRFDLTRASIIVAGTATAGMGAFHFLLPRLFGWARYTEALPVEIEWALFALNAFFSLLLLAGGLASLMAIRRTNGGTAWPIATMAAFWVFNAGYQLLRPFPTPHVRWLLFGFALCVALLYIAGLFSRRARTASSHGA